MEADWVKLRMDCSWKRLQGVVFRNVQSKPQPMSVVIEANTGQTLFTGRQGITCNPAWTLPNIPLSAYPITIHLLGEDGSQLWTDTADLRELYFVTSDLKDMEWLQGIAVLFHFYNEGYYSVPSLASEACEAAKNNSQQIKISVTTLAQAREVDFAKLQSEYTL